MKYKCIDNDVIIEHNRKENEIYVKVEGETSKTVIGVVDLKMALEKFNLCRVKRSVRGNVLVDQSINDYEAKSST